MATQPKFIVVIGASAGGLNALVELVSNLPAKMDAAIVIVLHLSSKGISTFLANQLQQHTTWHCKIGANDIPLETNCLYVAPPDFHIMVTKEKVIVGEGAKENRWRPSIDVLFRSAAVAFSTRCVGIILTGLLDDGTSGMMAIKRSGGITIVQDPNEAEFPGMPFSVLYAMEINYCIRLSEIGKTLEMVTQLYPAEITLLRRALIVSDFPNIR